MKKLFYFAAVILTGLALTFTSCGDDEEDPIDNNSNNEQNNNGNTEQTIDASIKGFIPEEYKGKKVVAWYFCENVDPTKNKPEGVYAFDDGSVVVTSIDNGTKITEFYGKYTLTGDYDNGTLTITVMGIKAAEMKIEKGIIGEPQGRYSYIKQDNSKIPAYAKADKDEMMDDTQHGEDIDEIIEPFYPTKYADKKVAAWYANTNIENDRTKTESVFRFDDGTVAKTTYKYKTHNNSLERVIDFEGAYTVTGSLSNGTVTVQSVTGETLFDVTISDGILVALAMGNATFKQQDNAKLPTATDETAQGDYGNNEGDNNGGNGNDDGDDDGEYVEAFLPKSYADKEVKAWYEYQNIDGNSKLKILAIFIFNDNSLVVTKAKYNLFDSNVTREIEYTGFCELNEGDYQDGIVYADNGMTIKIVDGIITIPNEDGSTEMFEWQFLDDLPTPTDETKD